MTTSQEATWRRLKPAEIGQIVKSFREMLGWKQITLAHEARTTERTIQRLEAGDRMSEQTMRLIAKAFKLTDEDYFVKPQEMPTKGEIERRVAEWHKQFVMIDVSEATGQGLVDLILASSSFVLDHPRPENLEQKDAIGALLDNIMDWDGILRTVSPSERLDAAGDFDRMVRELNKEGCAAFTASRQVRFNFKDGKPWDTSIGYVLIRPRGEPLQRAAVLRSPKLQF